jgi:hypothetical protein
MLAFVESFFTVIAAFLQRRKFVLYRAPIDWISRAASSCTCRSDKSITALG